MRIIDSHGHIYDRKGYVYGLLKQMDQFGIEKMCISGLGRLFDFVDDSEIKKIIDRYPERFIGQVYIRPGFDKPAKVQWGFENGFKMVKVTLPFKGYECPSYFELWAKALEYNMPVLFHTGTVACKAGKGQKVSSWNMHPMRLEPITRQFEDLVIIAAHMGVHWNEDAAELARMRPNVYVDITGEPGGWRERLKRDGLDRYLWWQGAFEKVIFGTDVHFEKVGTILSEDMMIYNHLKIDDITKEKIFGGTILGLLGLHY